jgi:hypothetical protein
MRRWPPGARSSPTRPSSAPPTGRLAVVAERRRCPIVFVECRADEAAVRARLEARAHAPSLSDARWDTYLEQRREQEPLGPSEPHLVVDTSGSLATARAAAIRPLWHWRQGRPLTPVPR